MYRAVGPVQVQDGLDAVGDQQVDVVRDGVDVVGAGVGGVDVGLPFQHASLSGTRTAVTWVQLFIARIDAWSTGPSKNPQPCTQAYSRAAAVHPVQDDLGAAGVDQFVAGHVQLRRGRCWLPRWR